MSYKAKDIEFEGFDHWILRVKTGYEVYKLGVTHSTRVASFSGGEEFKIRAYAEMYRRAKVVLGYTDIIPLFGGGYAVGIEGEAPNYCPAIYDTAEEVKAEIDSINKDYQEQIADGERDPDDCYDGELARVCYCSKTKKLFILDNNDLPVEEIKWRDAL